MNNYEKHPNYGDFIGSRRIGKQKKKNRTYTENYTNVDPKAQQHWQWQWQ